MVFLILSSCKNRALLILSKIKNFKAKLNHFVMNGQKINFLTTFLFTLFNFNAADSRDRAVKRWDILHFGHKIEHFNSHPAR